MATDTIPKGTEDLIQYAQTIKNYFWEHIVAWGGVWVYDVANQFGTTSESAITALDRLVKTGYLEKIDSDGLDIEEDERFWYRRRW